MPADSLVVTNRSLTRHPDGLCQKQVVTLLLLCRFMDAVLHRTMRCGSPMEFER